MPVSYSLFTLERPAPGPPFVGTILTSSPISLSTSSLRPFTHGAFRHGPRFPPSSFHWSKDIPTPSLFPLLQDGPVSMCCPVHHLSFIFHPFFNIANAPSSFPIRSFPFLGEVILPVFLILFPRFLRSKAEVFCRLVFFSTGLSWFFFKKWRFVGRRVTPPPCCVFRLFPPFDWTPHTLALLSEAVFSSPLSISFFFFISRSQSRSFFRVFSVVVPAFLLFSPGLMVPVLQTPFPLACDPCKGPSFPFPVLFFSFVFLLGPFHTSSLTPLRGFAFFFS